VALLLLLLLGQGCAWVLQPFRAVPPPLLDVTAGDVPPIVDDLGEASLREAVAQSLAFYQRNPARVFSVAGQTYTGADFSAALRTFLERLPPGAEPAVLDEVVRSTFRVLRATGQGQAVRFTGYYMPLLRGTLESNAEFRHPLYGKPGDLLSVDVGDIVPGCDCAVGARTGRLENGTMVPYYTREEIDGRGALDGRGLEVAWTDDPIGLFFLHVQGSGQLLLPDGRTFHVNYAATNGRPYRSIGLYLSSIGALPAGGASMQKIREYLATNPAERDRIMYQNPRYTFFRIAERGPFGSTEVELTAGRSIATDPGVYPPGALAYVRTRVPVVDADEVQGSALLSRLVLNQDMGAAIKGPARVDIYFGAGEEAAALAGRTSAPGTLYFLVPRVATPRVQALPRHHAPRPGGDRLAGGSWRVTRLLPQAAR
jgi:membrane-bound lytic murein transglycosylase A